MIRLTLCSDYLEWFYTSETSAAIGDTLGFTLLPAFVAKNVVQKMVGLGSPPVSSGRCVFKPLVVCSSLM